MMHRSRILTSCLGIVLATMRVQAAPVGSCFDARQYSGRATVNGHLSSEGVITFDTDALTMNGANHGVLVTNQSGNVVLALFPYRSVDIQTGATVTVQGNRGLVISSRSIMTIDADLSCAGVAGNIPTTGTGGTGGTGGEDGVARTSYNSINQAGTRARGGNAGSVGRGYGGGEERYGGNGPGNGGGYGGIGGNADGRNGGLSYGDAALTNFYGGSGGGGSKANVSSSGGGGGGGAIQLTASTSITIESGTTISVTGGTGGGSGNAAGGGSGGGIMLCATKVTQNGTLNASGGNGGNSNAGGGGGGRIAIYANILKGDNAYNVSAGTGGAAVGAAGTYYTSEYPFPPSYRGTLITLY